MLNILCCVYIKSSLAAHQPSSSLHHCITCDSFGLKGNTAFSILIIRFAVIVDVGICSRPMAEPRANNK